MQLRRATTIDDMGDRLSRMMSDESRARGLAFQPRPSDVIISPYAKCGTTWLQQIVHSLRSGGDLDFGEISEVVPWLEMGLDHGVDIESEQRGALRAYKSHLSWNDVPKGGRYIVAFREPIAAMTSMYRFFEGWFFEPGSISYRDFACDYFLERDDQRNYWSHTLSWAERRGDPSVQLFAYEEMKDRLPDVVARVADFIGVDADEALLAIAIEQSGHASMKERASQFDERLTRRTRDADCGLPPDGVASKVGGGDRTPLVATDEIRERFDAKWRATLGRAAFASYEELARAVSL